MDKKIKVAIAADHAGYKLKKQLIDYLVSVRKLNVRDLGTNSTESVDYPDFGHSLAREIELGQSDMGISICGSGNGINMTANKHQGIRSALCWTEEIARLARAHNDANICALPGRFLEVEEAIVIVDKFLSTDFEGGRHERRKQKIALKPF